MVSWWEMLLAAGATARVSRLIVRDSVTEPLRFRVRYGRAQREEIRRTHRPPSVPAPPVREWLATLIGCAWCLSFWIAVLVIASFALWGGTPAWQLVASALTVSYAAGWLLAAEPR